MFTEREKDVFDKLRHALDDSKFALVKATMNGKEVTVIAGVEETGKENEIWATPLAIMVNEDISKTLKPIQ